MPSSLHRHQYEVFRTLLQAEREQRGLTQIQVAEKLKKPQSYVSKYERGERRLDLTEFVEIADIMEMNIPTFLKQYRNVLGRK
jgi:transcriptional regulator with XRE-family HTH domain